MHRLEVVICGGGIAGLEGLLRLHALAGDAVHMTLVTPQAHLDFRPFSVDEPFGGRPRHHVEIARIAADTGALWWQDSLHWVDRHDRVVHTRNGGQLRYDALLLAVGGRLRPSVPHMDVFTSEGGPEMWGHVLHNIDAGLVERLAFVIPDGPHWPLPLYGLALMTAQHATDRGSWLRIALVTAEHRPLEVFGHRASGAVEDLLRRAGIELITASTAEMRQPGNLLISQLHHDRQPLAAERTITIPVISGPDVQGIPGDGRHRFLPVTEYCRVRNTGGRVWAAGDGTDNPIKHGAIGAQQAAVAAACIAHLAGTAPLPEPHHPMLRAKLSTGAKPLYLSANLIAGQGWNTEVFERSPWDSDEELVAPELGSYLRRVATSVPEAASAT